MEHRLPPPPPPSPRQRAIIRLTWGGLSNREIAAALGCSADTVKWQQAEAYRRLGVDGRGDPRTLAAIWLYRQEAGMAVLANEIRAELWRRFMDYYCVRRIALAGVTKAEVRALINAADDWADANASAYNTAIPANIRAKFSAQDKAIALGLVCLKRAGEDWNG